MYIIFWKSVPALGVTVGFVVGVVVEVVVVEGLLGFAVDAVVVVVEGEAAPVEAPKFRPTPTPGNPNVLYKSGAEAWNKIQQCHFSEVCFLQGRYNLLKSGGESLYSFTVSVVWFE